MEIFFPHDKFLDGKLPQYIPLFSTPPPTKKSILLVWEMLSSRNILGQPVRYDHPWEKEKKQNKKINKHASVISLLAKNTKFHIFVDRSLKLIQ